MPLHKFCSKILFSIFLINLLIICNLAQNRNYWHNENIPLDISRNLVYSSSNAPDSNSIYVNDDNMDTCFLSQKGILDNGSHWVLLDLGSLVKNITQIHLKTNSKPPENSKLSSDISVLGAREIPTLPAFVGGSYHIRQGIDWSYFTKCSDSGTVLSGIQRVTIYCQQPLEARWLLIARKDVLNFCYLQVVVNDYRPDCYTQIDNKISNDLSVFRNERYIGLQQCRQMCSTEFSCQGLAYQGSNRPYSGVCDLLFTSRSSRAYQPICDESCIMEENKCHKGEAKRLIQTGRRSYKVNFVPDGWYLISLQIDATISCDVGQCAPVRIIVADTNGRNWSCTFVYSQKVSLLKTRTLTCDKPIRNAEYVYLELIKDQINNYLSVNLVDLYSVHGRFLPELPTTPSITTKVTTMTTTGRQQTTTIIVTTRRQQHDGSPINTTTHSSKSPTTTTTTMIKQPAPADKGQRGEATVENKSFIDEQTDSPGVTQSYTTDDRAQIDRSVNEEEARLPYLWIIILAVCLVFLIVLIAILLMAYYTRNKRNCQYKKPPPPPENGEAQVMTATAANNGHSNLLSNQETPLIVIKDEDNNDIVDNTMDDSLTAQIFANGNASSNSLET